MAEPIVLETLLWFQLFKAETLNSYNLQDCCSMFYVYCTYVVCMYIYIHVHMYAQCLYNLLKYSLQ